MAFLLWLLPPATPAAGGCVMLRMLRHREPQFTLLSFAALILPRHFSCPRSNITIPATFVTKSTGEALKALMKGGQPVYVVMDWQDILPKKQQVGWAEKRTLPFCFGC